LTQICHDWEKDLVGKDKILATKDRLISDGEEKLKRCERSNGEKSTSIGTFESRLNNCNRDLNNCTNFVARAEAEQLKMMNQMRDDLHYAGIYSTCCAKEAKLRCNAELLAARYTCLPIYLLEDTCFAGQSQGQELWDIPPCITLSDNSLLDVINGSLTMDFILVNPKTFSILMVLILFAIGGFGTFIHFLISICYKKYCKTPVNQSSLPGDSGIDQSSSSVITPPNVNDQPEIPANIVPDAAQNQMNEDIRAAELACEQMYSTVHDLRRSSGEGAVGPRLPDLPTRPSRLRPPSYEFLARQAQVRLSFPFVLKHTILIIFLIQGGIF
jgi:hypothetical protein